MLGLFVEKSVGDYDERIRAQLREFLEGRIDLALGAGVEHTDVLAERPRGRLQVWQPRRPGAQWPRVVSGGGIACAALSQEVMTA